MSLRKREAVIFAVLTAAAAVGTLVSFFSRRPETSAPGVCRNGALRAAGAVRSDDGQSGVEYPVAVSGRGCSSCGDCAASQAAAQPPGDRRFGGLVGPDRLWSGVRGIFTVRQGAVYADGVRCRSGPSRFLCGDYGGASAVFFALGRGTVLYLYKEPEKWIRS